jgi:mannose-6-phosphate isomerase-like protein (cupin superfamily)
MIDVASPDRSPMTDPHRGAATVIDRRHAIQCFALALSTLGARDLLAEDATRPTTLQPAPVTFLDAEALLKAIRTAPEEKSGQSGLYSLLLSGDAGPTVVGIRRTAPTRSEVHTAFADVWYVLEGSGTLVTGGTIVDGVETGTGEIRGQSIAGGAERQILAGDFAVVPAGVPHWVSRVGPGELLYLVVKVPTPSA